MIVLRRSVLRVALLAFVLAGCNPTATGPGSPTEPARTEAPAPSEAAVAPEALIGSYSVEYRTTESDHDAITDETIIRDSKVTGSCTGTTCDLTFTTELKGADGSIQSGTTALTFDGAAYHGTSASTFSCDGLSTLTTVEDGLEYTSETTITPATTITEDGRVVVATFDVVTIELNEITAGGRDAGCLRINLSGPDPFVTHDTTVGVGTRQT